MARGADRFNRHVPARALGLEDAARRWAARLSLRLRHRRLERRLDHVLGSDAVQHAGRDRRLRQAAALADPAGNSRRTGADHPVRLGVRRVARRPGRLRLSVGLRRADPDHARHSGARCDPRRGHRQQRAGVIRRARRADHRLGRGDRHAAFGAGRLGRQDRRYSRAVAAVDPALSGQRQERHDGRLAARRGRLARLHRRPIADLDLSRAVSARRHRRHHLLRLPPDPAQVLASGANARLWRRPGDGGAGGGQAEGHGLSAGEVFQGWLPIIVLIVVVVAWTGPWSQVARDQLAAFAGFGGVFDHRRRHDHRRSST